MKRIYNAIKTILCCILVRIFSIGIYDKKYFKGKWFDTMRSSGWVFAYTDLKRRFATKKNLEVKWPVSSDIFIVMPQNIKFDIDDINNFQSFGQYYQAYATIEIGRGSYIAPNVGLITANHTLLNLDEHDNGRPIKIGESCWIGMNSTVLPGVTLGNHTIVGAGSVVTKSFPEGGCVIAGNPAKIIKKIE
ncbi:MAG: DapH/DapD/GlmU-related protein [Clostridia bacterium]